MSGWLERKSEKISGQLRKFLHPFCIDTISGQSKKDGREQLKYINPESVNVGKAHHNGRQCATICMIVVEPS